jgi:ADP-heptose:LPS heptosyltransferase
VVAADSGPLHLAAMMGTPVVGLYGPVSPLEFGPLCPPGRCRVVRVQLPCSPCGTLLDPPCGARAAPACVSGIGVEAVLAAAAELL